MLAELVNAGFSHAVAARAAFLFNDYVTNFVIEEGRGEAMAAAVASAAGGDGQATIRQWFAALPADQFPTLVELADELTDSDMDARFEFGLRALIEGMRAHHDAPDSD
jgi:TetR/AcrR family tetracycline transcriptional repressor